MRHGESEWNASGKITGRADVALTEAGRAQARQIGKSLSVIRIDTAYISKLRRTAETLSGIQGQCNAPIPYKKHAALNERDYGVLTGKLKKEVAAKIGPEAYTAMLLGWDVAPPEGESLEMVYHRVVPYFQHEIVEGLQKGRNILIVSHHHTLRALVKYVENLSEDEVIHLRLNNAEATIYVFDPEHAVFLKKTT